MAVKLWNVKRCFPFHVINRDELSVDYNGMKVSLKTYSLKVLISFAMSLSLRITVFFNFPIITITKFSNLIGFQLF